MAWVAPVVSAVAPLVLQWLSSMNSGDEEDPEIRSQSTLAPEQQGLLKQVLAASRGMGAGGAFGDAADYYRSNLGNTPADFQAFAAPELRRYNEEIVPGLSEQFAGMGAGGLSSSGFRNAQVQGGVDLSERLAGLRAQLRQNSAQGLTGIGQIGLGNYSENVRNQPQPNAAQSSGAGFGEMFGKAIPGLVGAFSGGGGGGGTTTPPAGMPGPIASTSIYGYK